MLCVSDLCKAEKRLLGLSSTGPIGSMVPLSLTQFRYPRVISAMPMALAEQYMNLYPFLWHRESLVLSLVSTHTLCAGCKVALTGWFCGRAVRYPGESSLYPESGGCVPGCPTYSATQQRQHHTTNTHTLNAKSLWSPTSDGEQLLQAGNFLSLTWWWFRLYRRWRFCHPSSKGKLFHGSDRCPDTELSH